MSAWSDGMKGRTRLQTDRFTRPYAAPRSEDRGMPPPTPSPQLAEQLQTERRTVDFDTFDIRIQQLLAMLQSKSIDIAPAYQREFRWDLTRCSQLVESFLLGIPVPSLFMATNADGTWELVDGVQRLCSIVTFAGPAELRERLKIGEPLRPCELQKLTTFNDFTFHELPATIQLQFQLRPAKVVTLSDKSDMKVRFDLFERLNTGGVALTHQEIRGCVYGGNSTPFSGGWLKTRTFARRSDSLNGRRWMGLGTNASFGSSRTSTATRRSCIA